MSSTVDVSTLEIDEPGWLPSIEEFCLRVLDELNLTGWELSILFCSDTVIRDLNKRFRGKDEPTDVLSFEQGPAFEGFSPDPENGGVHVAGDIVISLETLGRNAEIFSVDRGEELKRLLVHGILHLTGMDHPDNAPEREMLILQEKIVGKLSEEKLF